MDVDRADVFFFELLTKTLKNPTCFATLNRTFYTVCPVNILFLNCAYLNEFKYVMTWIKYNSN